MRIVQLKSAAGRGGAETLLLQLTCAFRDLGHDIRTIVGENGWLVDQLQRNSQHVEVRGVMSIRGFLEIPRLVGVMRRQDADVVIAHGARANLFGSLAARLAGVPSVSVEHNVDDWRESSVLNAVDRFSGSLNAHRIAVSDAVRRALLEHAIIPAERLSVIPNGVMFPSAEMSPSQRRMLRSRFGYADEHFVYCTVARLVEQKGHRYLLSAVAQLCRDLPHVRFLLLGDGALREALEKQVRDLAIQEYVQMAGAVDDVITLLPAFDGFVLPSLFEGMPIAILEAMGAGLPVVATEVAGTPEVITHGITGVLVPPRDGASLLVAMRELCANTTQTALMAQRGRSYVRSRHSLELVARRYISLLEDIVNTYQRPSQRGLVS